MRKVKLQMQMTVNGFVAAIDGKSDWMTGTPDDDFIEFLQSLLDTADTLLLGRKTAESILPFWENMASENPGHPLANRIASIKKVVFTNTLNQSNWSKARLAKGSLAEEITKLKQENGKDVLVFGGAQFVAALIKEGLIDEYHLIVNPTAMSSGLTIFHSIEAVMKFTPIQSKLYQGGKTVLSFLPKND